MLSVRRLCSTLEQSVSPAAVVSMRKIQCKLVIDMHALIQRLTSWFTKLDQQDMAQLIARYSKYDVTVCFWRVVWTPTLLSSQSFQVKTSSDSAECLH